MAPAQRLALLAGVDLYPNLPPKAQLRSCVNDARLMAATLEGHHGFRHDDIQLLLDEGATRDAILAGLEELRRRARDGDVVLFYWSGHGSRVKDLSGGSPDGWCESIVPHDSGREPAPNRDISDGEIYAWLLAVSDLTRAPVVVAADSCFAGGVIHPWLGEVKKWIVPDARPLPPAECAAAKAPPGGSTGPSGFLPLDGRYVLLAACLSGQGAKELPDRAQSAFTFCLSEELKRAPPGATYGEVMARVCDAIAREVQDQTPQVEGERDRILFDEPPAQPGQRPDEPPAPPS